MKLRKESNKGYFLEVDVQILKILPNLYNYLPFFPGSTRI